MINNLITLMKKKIIIGSLSLIAILILLVITVSALHPLNAPELKAECPQPGAITVTPALVPSVVLISKLGEDSFYDINIPMKNLGYREWRKTATKTYKLKMTSGPLVNINNGEFGFLETSVPGTHATSNVQQRIANFKITNIKAPEQAQELVFKWRVVEKRTIVDEPDTESVETPEPAYRNLEGPECEYRLKIEKIDAECKNLGNGGPIRIFNPEFVASSGLDAQEQDHEVLPNDYYVIKAKMKNIGSTIWKIGYTLEGTIGDQQVSIPITSFSPGGLTDFTRLTDELRTIPSGQEAEFTFSADSRYRILTPGTYPINLRLKYGNKLFGETCTGNLLVVGRNENSICGVTDEDTTRGITLTSKENGKKLDIEVKMKNSGNTVWRAGTYVLGYTIPFLNIPNEMMIMDTPVDRQAAQRYKVRPGEIATFKTMNLDITNPSVNPQFRNYDLQFKMRKGDTIGGYAHYNQEFGATCTKQVEIRPRFAPA